VLVLAGDIGGTNSRFALFRDERRSPIFERTYPSAGYATFELAVVAFLRDAGAALGGDAHPARACLGVAGPVAGGASRVTNLPWFVDASRIAQQANIPEVTLVNDFQAAAYGVTLLGPEHLFPLGGGKRNPTGPVAVLGPGTGLGEAFLIWCHATQSYEVVPSEGGHADFAPRTPLEAGLLAYLAARYGRVSYERMLSGPGLRDLFSYLMTEPAYASLATSETQAALDDDNASAVIVRQANSGRDPLCTLTVSLFASALGALAGNLALTVLATGGVFVAGGIAPRITDLLASPFRQAFDAKGRLEGFLSKVPAFVVTHAEVGLLGAAALAVRGAR